VKARVLLTDSDRFPFGPGEVSLLRDAGVALDELPGHDRDAVARAGAGADGIFVYHASFDARLLGRLGACRVLARCGAGYDNIDVAAARARGVQVTYVPEYGTDDVAEHALALLLACARRLAASDRAVQAGGWPSFGELGPMRRLGGSTLGLIGFGRIARALAARAIGLGMQVVASDPYVSARVAEPAGVRLCSMDEVLEQAQYLSVHVPLTQDTRHLIGAAALGQMRSDCYLINTSRGQVVDQQALVDALDAGQIAGAALDVLDREPPAPGSAILHRANVLITPHSAALTEEALGEVRRTALADVLRVLSGEPPLFPVPGLAAGSAELVQSERRSGQRVSRQGDIMTELIVGAQETDTHQKALRINLDPRWYGTIAEIGAGQEVVRWFFRVGGAAGTVAKSISAYDMAVSDAVYGKAERYVSMGRLQGMLDKEFQLNVERLDDERGDMNCFFAFADTVVARSFRGGNECHGWMGVKFQAQPHDEPSQIVMHVRMLDVEAFAQQEALGIVGLNLLYGAFFHHHESDKLIESLLDRLTTGRIEIDMIQFRGIEFRGVDNRLMALKLVQVGLSGVAMFGPDREVLQPSEVLRKKAVLVERGSFRPPTHVNLDMLATAKEKFAQDPAVAGKPILQLTEITMRNLLAGGQDVDRRDFLARAELLAACGETVLITDYFDYYRLAAYIGERTSERIGIVMGVPSLIDLFDEKNHAQLPGGILESFGRLFKNGLKLYVYPHRPNPDDELRTVDSIKVQPELQPLYDYLHGRGSFVDLDNFRPEYLPIFSRDVLRRIAAQDDSWETMVPAEVVELIKRRAFFGYVKPIRNYEE
jgi:phosphoglycerate dehydrogenase-like enzyme